MTIKTRLEITSLVYVAVTVGVALTVFTGMRNLQRDLEASRTNYALVTCLLDLAILADDYVIHPERRPLRQWQAKYSEMAKLLGKGASLETVEPETINRLIEDNEEINSVFSQLVSVQAKIQSDKGPSKASIELRDKLQGMLGLQLQSMISDARELYSASQARIDARLAWSMWIAILFSAVTASIILGNHILTGRALISPLTKLIKGTQIIASGMLDHVVDIKSRDEMGGLARAFNSMTADLKKSYGALETEIKERELAEEALRKSEALLKEVQGVAHIGHWELDVPGGIPFWSEEIFHIFGLDSKQGEPSLEAHRQLIHAEDWQLLDSSITRAITQGVPYDIEFRVVRPDGSLRWLNAKGRPTRNVQGAIFRLFGTAQDITQRKQAEDALRASEEKFAKSFQHAPVLITLSNPDDGTYIEVNDRFCQVSGFSCTEAVGRTSVELGWISPEDRMLLIEQMKAHGRVEGMELKLLAKHKREVHCIYNGELIQIDNRRYLLSIALDITDRKKAEQALRDSQQTLGTMVARHPESFLLVDIKGTILECSETTAERLGRPVQEFIGSCVYDHLPPDVAQDRRERVNGVIRTARPIRWEDSRWGRIIDNHVQPIIDDQGKVVRLAILSIDITNLRKAEDVQRRLATAIEQSAEAVVITDVDGVIHYVNPAVERITGYERAEIIGNTPRIFKSGEHDRAFYEQLWNTITAGNVWSGRLVNRKKDGTIYHEDAIISPVLDASGEIVNFVAVKRDVTERLELSKQLFQAQKMEAIGALAGGVAHDFNNILTVIIGFSELLLSEQEDQYPEYADLQKINQAARKGADLVQRLLAFSRKAETKPRPLDLNQQIEQIQRILNRTIPKTIRMESNLADGLNRVNADPTQMDQVLMNLAVNAKDAMPHGGILTFATANVFLGEEYARAHLGAKPGEYVLLSVSDTGVGIDRETQDHIFEPFFTTKEPGKGTGLGLAMVYGIVTRHDGVIRCYSQPGQGTTFNIYLPALAPERVQLAVTAREAVPKGGTETLLVVDDEESIMDLAKRILEFAGYKVISAANGLEALKSYEKERETISLILLDMVMPEMDGKECLEQLLKINPEARVVIASGILAPERIKEMLQLGAKAFMSKPFKATEILQTVREVLDQR